MPIWMPRLDVASDQPFFRMIVQSLADDIASGRLAAGTRLPTHRELADRLGIARGTVARAYADAEQLGLIRGDVGRGSFVLALKAGHRPYGTLLEVPNVGAELGGNFPLSGIDPDPSEALSELARRPDRNFLLRYQSPLGLARHRAAGAEWARWLGVATSMKSVLLCAGAQHAIFVIAAHLLGPGDGLFVEEWSYPGIHGVLETLRLRPIPLAMDSDGLLPDSFEAGCKAKRAQVLYCMPTVHNPTGAVLSASRSKAIVDIARRYGISIIEDAANRLAHERPPPSLFSLAPERTYFVASMSKMLGAGLRVAFLVAEPAAIPALERKVFATHWCVSPIGPELATIWMERGVAKQTIARKRREAKWRQALASRILGGQNIEAYPGSLHLWLRLPPPVRAAELVARALQRDIAVTPSAAFWMRQTRPPEHLRLALGGIDDRRDLQRKLRVIASLLPSSIERVGSRQLE